jgi:hypothetical protein
VEGLDALIAAHANRARRQRSPLRVGRLRVLAEPVAGDHLFGQRPVAAHRLDGRVDDRRVIVVEEVARRLLPIL